MICTKRQREEYVRSRVILNPPKVQAKEIAALYKIVMIGNSGCGKSCLLMRFSENVFNQYQGCTVGLDFKIKLLKIDQKIIKL